MKNKKKNLKDKERIILEVLHAQGGVMTANEISQITGISYVTVRKYLNKLIKEDIIVEVDLDATKKRKK